MAEAGAAEVEARPQLHARSADVGQEDQQLGRDAERRPDAQQGLLRRGEPGDLLGGSGLPERHQVDDEYPYRDHVVGDRRPHHRAEPAAGVEDLTDQDEHAVEEDLRQAEPREVDGRLSFRGQPRVVVLAVEEHVHHHRRCNDQKHGDGAEEEHGEGDDPVDVRRPAVGVVLHRPHELGDQDGVEDASRQQDVEHVGDRVRDGEQVGVQADAQREREQRGADEPAEPGDDGAGRHHRAVGQDPALLVPGIAGVAGVAGVAGIAGIGHATGSGLRLRIRRTRRSTIATRSSPPPAPRITQITSLT